MRKIVANSASAEVSISIRPFSTIHTTPALQIALEIDGTIRLPAEVGYHYGVLLVYTTLTNVDKRSATGINRSSMATDHAGNGYYAAAHGSVVSITGFICTISAIPTPALVRTWYQT